MRIINCKTNHIVNPIGYDMSNVVVTWTVEETDSKIQESGQIKIALDKEMSNVLFDTGIQKDLDSRGYHVELELKPYTRYYWTVSIKGDVGDEAISEINYFETGKMQDAWKAQWITTEWKDQSISPYFRKTFKVNARIKQARAYIIGLGLYKLEINGRKVGNERFTPYCNSYDAWLQYQTYDITEILIDGENAAGVCLGNGWAKGPFGTFGPVNTPYINDYALMCEFHITYEDDVVEIINTDSSWLCHPSPIVEDTIYDGEIFDENLNIKGWSQTGIDTSDWRQSKTYYLKGLGPVCERLSVPVIVRETIKPLEYIKTPAGEHVLDMGQNMVGWLKIRINEPKGTTIKISHGEVLQEGNFYRENLRNAKSEYIYISDGTPKVIEPHFTFYGFRFAKLEGFTKSIELENFEGCVVYSDLDTIGNIETSDPLVNRLFLNTLWGQKGNFLDVPTDCPQRDERMGWTGDAQVFSGTALYNMDAYPFYMKFLKDLYEEQKFSEGMVASVIPTFSKIKFKESGFVGGGACAWSDAATVIPWEMYLHTGDATVLKTQYQSMKDWVDWIIKQDKNSGDNKLWRVGFHFGDWLALDGPVEGGVMGGTDTGLLASAYYRLSTNILSKTAKILNKNQDAKFYGELSEEIKKAIQDEYFSKTGRSTINTQTAHIVALHFDLVDEKVRNRVIEDLKALLNKSQMHLTTGFIGTPYLCRSLSDNGAGEEALKVFFQEDYPSWLYEVVMGATTIWERWNSILPDGKISGTGMNSLNHYAYGSIMEWVYRNVCGLQPVESDPGFKSFVIKPEITGKLKYAKATLNSAMGRIESGWKREEDGTVTINVKVPFNTTAKLFLPDPADKKDSIKNLEAGFHTFNYQTAKTYDLEYSLKTPLLELINTPETKVVLEKYAPHLLTLTKESMGFELPMSIGDVLDSDDGFMKGMFLRDADVKVIAEEFGKIPYKIREV